MTDVEGRSVMYGSSSGGSLLSAVLAGSVIYLVLWLGIMMLGMYVSYRIIRAGVRDGMVDAHAKTGGSSGMGGGPQIIQGYPPVQNYSAPVAPHAEQSQYPGYGG